MFRKVMLAGLMAATALGGITPAYAQSRGEHRGNHRVERPSGQAPRQAQRPARPQGDARRAGPAAQRQATPRPAVQRPDRQSSAAQRNWQQRNALQRNWQQRAQTDRPAARPAPQPRAESRWSGNRSPGVNPRQGVTDRRAEGNRRDWRNDNPRNRPDERRDNDRRAQDNRRWDNDRRADNRQWNNRPGSNQAHNRFDDRTRWASQRRWDNRWRNDRRYDWRNYRARYGERYRIGRYHAPRGWNYGYSRFSIGVMLGAPLYASSYWLNDPWSYRLPPAYGTLRWVRYYDDALLVDIRDGYVVDVIHDFFW